MKHICFDIVTETEKAYKTEDYLAIYEINNNPNRHIYEHLNLIYTINESIWLPKSQLINCKEIAEDVYTAQIEDWLADILINNNKPFC